jgi:hypothetical protein
MVSANLPQHTPLTEMNSLTRTAGYLVRRGTEATEAERNAYQTRKKALLTKLSRGDVDPELDEDRPAPGCWCRQQGGPPGSSTRRTALPTKGNRTYVQSVEFWCIEWRVFLVA